MVAQIWRVKLAGKRPLAKSLKSLEPHRHHLIRKVVLFLSLQSGDVLFVVKSQF